MSELPQPHDPFWLQTWIRLPVSYQIGSDCQCFSNSVALRIVTASPKYYILSVRYHLEFYSFLYIGGLLHSLYKSILGLKIQNLLREIQASLWIADGLPHLDFTQGLLS